MYKSCWPQWRSLAVRSGILEHQWESASGCFKITQIVFPQSRAKDLLTELHGGPSGGHLGVNKAMNKVWQRYYWLQARNNVEKWCWQCDTCAASCSPWTRNPSQMHQYNVDAPFERIAIDVAWSFPRSDQGNRYLLNAIDYFTKRLEAYAISSQEASTVVELLVTNFFCHFRVPAGDT
jgi:hypothetical protein